MSLLSETGPVLYPTDYSEAASAAHPYALYLAGLFGVDLNLLHVDGAGEEARTAAFPDPSDPWAGVSRWLAESPAVGGDGTEELEIPESHRETRPGDDPAEVILSYADEIGAGAICMGTRGRGGIGRLVLGSVTEKVVRSARRPVLTVRENVRSWGEGPRRLLVGADLSPMMKPALAWAGVLAAETGAELTSVHVVTSHAAAVGQNHLQEIHAEFRELGLEGVELEAELLIGDPRVEIRKLAEQREEVDLLVTSSHGRSGAARLVLGSVTESLVRRAPCPVLTVSEPPAGFADDDGGGED